jgi:hypothetical protein
MNFLTFQDVDKTHLLFERSQEVHLLAFQFPHGAQDFLFALTFLLQHDLVPVKLGSNR